MLLVLDGGMEPGGVPGVRAALEELASLGWRILVAAGKNLHRWSEGEASGLGIVELPSTGEATGEVGGVGREELRRAVRTIVERLDGASQVVVAVAHDGPWAPLPRVLQEVLGPVAVRWEGLVPAAVEGGGIAVDAAIRDLFPRVSIVLRCEGAAAAAREAVERVRRATTYPNWEMVVVGEGPGNLEHTAGLPRCSSFRIRYVEVEPGTGDGEKMTRGAREASGDFLCFLRVGTVPEPGWLSLMVRCLQEREETGAVVPVANAGPPGVRYRFFSRDRQPGGGRPVPWFTLDCFLLRAGVWSTVGGPEAEFEGVDVFAGRDLARRIRAAGFEVRCVPGARVRVAREAPPVVEERLELVRKRYRARWSAWKSLTRRVAVLADQEELVYDSARVGPPVLAELHQLLRYRDLVRLLTESNIKSRYKRSVLGVFWTLLNPLLHMTVLTVAFSAVFKSQVPHYPVYVLAGLIVWNFFSQVTSASMTAVISGGNLMRQIYIPPSVFCVATVAAGLVNVVLSLIPLAAIMVIVRHHFTIALVFVPAALFLLSLFTLGLSLALGALAVFFTDLVEFYGVLLRAGYFLTAVMYPITIIPEKWRWVIEINPVYSYIRLFRDPIYNGVFPPWEALLIGTVSALLALALGWWILARKAHEIVYAT